MLIPGGGKGHGNLSIKNERESSVEGSKMKRNRPQEMKKMRGEEGKLRRGK